MSQISDWLTKQMKDPEFIKRGVEYVKNKMKEWDEQDNKILDKYFPEHIGHTKKEGEEKYFDAMFVSCDFHCSCGEKLVMTREMTEKD